MIDHDSMIVNNECGLQFKMFARDICRCNIHSEFYPYAPAFFDLTDEYGKNFIIPSDKVCDMVHEIGSNIYITNFAPKYNTEINNKIYIICEITGGNHEGKFVLVEYDYINGKLVDFLQLPDACKTINEVVLSPDGRYIAIQSKSLVEGTIFNKAEIKWNLSINVIDIQYMKTIDKEDLNMKSTDIDEDVSIDWIDNNLLRVEYKSGKTMIINIDT